MVLILPTPVASFVAARDNSVKRWRLFFRGIAILQGLIGVGLVILGDKDGLIACFMSVFLWRLVDSSLSWVIFVGISMASHACMLQLRHNSRIPSIEENEVFRTSQRVLRLLLGLVDIAGSVVACYVYRQAAPTDRAMFGNIIPLIDGDGTMYTSGQTTTTTSRPEVVVTGGRSGETFSPFSGAPHCIRDCCRESVVLPPTKHSEDILTPTSFHTQLPGIAADRQRGHHVVVANGTIS